MTRIRRQTSRPAIILMKAVTAIKAPTAEEHCQRGLDLLAAGSPAEAAAARARVLEWKIQLQSPPHESPARESKPDQDPQP
jgi:hypothetical protein